MTRRKKSKNPMKTAAEFGEAEVREELKGNLNAARSFGKAEARERGRSQSRGNSRRYAEPASESSLSSQYTRVATSPIYPLNAAAPTSLLKKEVSVHLDGSGLTYGSFYTRDPFRSNRMEVIVNEYNSCNWSTFQVPTPGTADTTANSLGTRVSAFYNNLVDILNFNGRFTPNNTLAVPGDFAKFINEYSVAFSILWTYQAVASALDINASTKSFGPGIGGSGNISHAAELWRRLQVIPIPRELPIFLSKVFGVFYAELENLVFIANLNTAATSSVITDWTLATGANSVDTLLTLAETNIALLEGNTSEANLITELFAVVYGVPDAFPQVYVNSNKIAFDLQYTRATVFKVATEFAVPSMNGAQAAGIVPIFLRSGMTGDPYKEILFSFLRPQFYDAATIGSHATSSQVGLFTVGANNDSNFGRLYGPTDNDAIITDTSFAAINYGASFYESEYWSAFTASTSGIVDWKLDNRSYDRWNIFYPSVGSLADQSLILLNKIFLSGTRLRELR